MRTSGGNLLRALGLAAWWGLAASAAVAATTLQRTEQGGVAIAFDYAPAGDGSGVARLTLSDARSGRGIEGARPAAWLLARRSEQVAAETSCEDKARALVSGSLGQRPEVDLNGYRLVTLNHDNTVAFINPLVRLGTTQLESIVELPATGHDWVWAPRAQRLLVSLRDAGAVALIDTVSRRLVATLRTGEGSLPTRLVLDPDGRRAWLGLDGRDEVLAIDLQDGRIAGRARVGRGVHTLAAPQQSALLFVTNSVSDSVSLVERGSLETVAHIPVGATPVASAWSAAAQRLAVLSINGGSLSLIDGEARTLQASVPLARGVVALGLFDDGRRALVLNSRDDMLALVDLASARKVAERKMPARPDQIAFTREFAYLRSQSTSAVQLIALAQAREGRLDGVSVPMGRSAPEEAPDEINVASVFAVAPEGNGVLLANPGDGSIYRYAQGLMVPVNSHSNYRRRARALMVLDASLSERQPGHFEAPVRFGEGGRYDMVVRNLRPAITACFTVSVEGAASAPAMPAAPKPRLLTARRVADEVVELEFALGNAPGSAAPLQDVAVLAVQRAGTWQARTRAESLGDGRWRAQLHGLPRGRFEVMVAAPALPLAFADGRLGSLQWPLPAKAVP